MCYVAYDPEAEKRLVKRIVQSICHCVSGFGVWMHGDTKSCEPVSEPPVQSCKGERDNAGRQAVRRPLRICDKEIQRVPEGIRESVVSQRYVLPDSRTMRVGAERFMAPEILLLGFEVPRFKMQCIIQRTRHVCGGCWASSTSAVWRMDGLCVFTPPVRVLDTLFHQINTPVRIHIRTIPDIHAYIRYVGILHIAY